MEKNKSEKHTAPTIVILLLGLFPAIVLAAILIYLAYDKASELQKVSWFQTTSQGQGTPVQDDYLRRTEMIQQQEQSLRKGYQSLAQQTNPALQDIARNLEKDQRKFKPVQFPDPSIKYR